jgi:hypothetical protein
MAERAPPEEQEQWSAPRGGCAGLAALCLLLLVALPFLLLRSCVSHEEVARVAAPGGQFQAVLVEVNGGATTDFAYSVRIEGMGLLGFEQEVAWLYGAHRSACAYGVNLRWAAPNRLLIEYRDAKQVRTTPAEVGGRGLKVELKPGTTDVNAPCGGMEYSQRRRRGG